MLDAKLHANDPLEEIIPEKPVYERYRMPRPIVSEDFQHVQSTEFRIAEGPLFQSNRATLIIPGFGVSVDQVDVDSLLWRNNPHTIITHDAINYPTEQQFMLQQYVHILRSINPISWLMIGLSLGGSTSIQLLTFLQKNEPELYARCRKLITLVSPVEGTDLTPRWQRTLRRCRIAADPADTIRRKLQSGALNGSLMVLQPFFERGTALETESADETRNIMAYAAKTFDGASISELRPGMFELPITSIGLKEDHIAANTNAARFSKQGRHIIEKGIHGPTFYAQGKDRYDALILGEMKRAA